MGIDIAIGGMFIFTGSYTWWYMRRNPHKVASWMGARKGQLLCLVAIIAGVTIILASLLPPGR
jgi:hypothetical protein